MMNKTQKTIVLTGDPCITGKALEIIKGFKAVSVVKMLTPATVRNVYYHNKNVVYYASGGLGGLDLKMVQEYRPIVLNCISGKSKIDQMQLGTDNIIEDFPKLLESLNIDSGDHVLFDSKDSGEARNNCFICKVVEGKPDHPEHVLYESNNFLAIPGLGAFFEGYVMIVPKRHIMSFAELKPEEFEEFLRVLNDLRFILESIYGKKIFVFECGSGRDGGGKHSTSIVHAHVHLAPTDMPVLECVQNSGLHPAQIMPRDLIADYGKYAYMLYITQEDNWYITSDPKTYFPRQHPRQVLADYMGLSKGEYNWRTHPYRERLDSIAEEIYSFLRKEFKNLPVWIQRATEKNF